MGRLLRQMQELAEPLMTTGESMKLCTWAYRKSQRELVKGIGGFARVRLAEEEMQRNGAADGFPPYLRLGLGLTNKRILVWGDRGRIVPKLTGQPTLIELAEVISIDVVEGPGSFKTVEIHHEGGETLALEMRPEAAAGLRSGLASDRGAA